MADVRLVDLDVIKRYSLAIRMESAPADEVLAALEASRETVLAAIESQRPRTTRTSSSAPRARAAAKTPARRAPARKARGT